MLRLMEMNTIQFNLKKRINVGRDLFNICGEMLIFNEDFFIIKHKVSFDFLIKLPQMKLHILK